MRRGFGKIAGPLGCLAALAVVALASFPQGALAQQQAKFASRASGVVFIPSPDREPLPPDWWSSMLDAADTALQRNDAATESPARRLAALFGATTDLETERQEAPSALPPLSLDGDRPFPYMASDQPASEILAEFGKNLGIPTVIEGDASARVSIDSATLKPREFLERVTASAGLSWYFDGSTLHIGPVGEVRSRLFDLGGVSIGKLRSTIAELGLADNRYPIRGTRDDRLAVVHGPPPYVRAVENVVLALGGGGALRANGNDGADQTAPMTQNIRPRVFRGPKQ